MFWSLLSVAVSTVCIQDGNCLWLVVHQTLSSLALLLLPLANSCLTMKVIVHLFCDIHLTPVNAVTNSLCTWCNLWLMLTTADFMSHIYSEILQYFKSFARTWSKAYNSVLYCYQHQTVSAYSRVYTLHGVICSVICHHLLVSQSSCGAMNFHLGDIPAFSGVQGRRPGRGSGRRSPPEAEAVCRHC